MVCTIHNCSKNVTLRSISPAVFAIYLCTLSGRRLKHAFGYLSVYVTSVVLRKCGSSLFRELPIRKMKKLGKQLIESSLFKQIEELLSWFLLLNSVIG